MAQVKIIVFGQSVEDNHVWSGNLQCIPREGSRITMPDSKEYIVMTHRLALGPAEEHVFTARYIGTNDAPLDIMDAVLTVRDFLNLLEDKLGEEYVSDMYTALEENMP